MPSRAPRKLLVDCALASLQVTDQATLNCSLPAKGWAVQRMAVTTPTAHPISRIQVEFVLSISIMSVDDKQEAEDALSLALIKQSAIVEAELPVILAEIHNAWQLNSYGHIMIADIEGEA